MEVTYGQIFRAVNLTSEDCIYNLDGSNCVALGGTGSASAWLQWTQAPPSAYDLDGDGKNEIIARDISAHTEEADNTGVMHT